MNIAITNQCHLFEKIHPGVVKTVIVDCLNDKLTPFEQISFLRVSKTLNSYILHWQIFTKEFREVVSSLNALNPPIKIFAVNNELIRLFAIAKVNNISLEMSLTSRIDTRIQTSILMECIRISFFEDKHRYINQFLHLIHNEREPYVELDCRCIAAKTLIEYDYKIGIKNFKAAYKEIKKRPINIANRDEIGDKLYLLAKAIIKINPKKACRDILRRMSIHHVKAVKAMLLAAKNIKSNKYSYLYLQEAIQIAEQSTNIKDRCRIMKAFRFLPQTAKFKNCADDFTLEIVNLLNTKYRTCFEKKLPLLCQLYEFYAFQKNELSYGILNHISEIFKLCKRHFLTDLERRSLCFLTASFFSRIDPSVYIDCLSDLSSKAVKIDEPYDAVDASINLSRQFITLAGYFEYDDVINSYILGLRININNNLKNISFIGELIHCMTLNFLKFFP